MSARPASVVLVTGGAGLVGSAVVRRLAERGDEVHVLGRASSRREGLAGVACTWHDADLEHPDSIQAVVRECARAADAVGRPLDVLHCAARISYRRADGELLRRTNVEGTRHVLAACVEARVRRLCHVSSVVALGPVRDPDSFLEDDAPLGGLALGSSYARTKAQAEELVRAAASELDAVVASPAVVFGPAPAGSNSLHFLRRVVRGTFGPLSPPGSLSVVGIDDVAQGIVSVLDRGARGCRYLLAESAWRLHDLLRLACRAAGRRGPRAMLPAGAWSALVALLDLADRVVPAERATPEALRLLGLHFRFRSRRAREELGWSPRSFERVLDETVAWLRSTERGERPA